VATYALIHGGGDVGWYWHLLEAELRRRGHDVVAPDLPCEDDTAGLAAVVAAVGDRSSHCVALSRPWGLADRLEAYLGERNAPSSRPR
jgi:hypothetical protein